jgi:hypothetical protein
MMMRITTRCSHRRRRYGHDDDAGLKEKLLKGGGRGERERRERGESEAEIH